jgi:crotonobetainyl-CoA:carnitine CoA-transferase CaiB-like acyl-CoA transferase
MNVVVSHQRQLNREEFMTPGEFARRLEEAGLPTEPVRKLTELFERARYSSRASQNGDAADATQCLAAITLALDVTE